jgi:hypothetical protein
LREFIRFSKVEASPLRNKVAMPRKEDFIHGDENAMQIDDAPPSSTPTPSTQSPLAMLPRMLSALNDFKAVSDPNERLLELQRDRLQRNPWLLDANKLVSLVRVWASDI